MITFTATEALEVARQANLKTPKMQKILALIKDVAAQGEYCIALDFGSELDSLEQYTLQSMGFDADMWGIRWYALPE
jgi:hypothetical protein